MHHANGYIYITSTIPIDKNILFYYFLFFSSPSSSSLVLNIHFFKGLVMIDDWYIHSSFLYPSLHDANRQTLITEQHVSTFVLFKWNVSYAVWWWQRSIANHCHFFVTMVTTFFCAIMALSSESFIVALYSGHLRQMINDHI